ENIRDTFLRELDGFYSKGEMPSHVSINMQHALTEHHKRLKSKGLAYSERFEHTIDERASQATFDFGAFKMTNALKHCNAIIDLTDGRSRLRVDDASDDVVHCHILDRAGDASNGSDAERIIACPNCGHRTAAKDAVNGCPMCGTKFKIDDLYPCVNTYYSMIFPMPKQNSIENSMHRATIIGVCVGVIIALLVGILMGKDGHSAFLIGFAALIAGALVGWATFLLSFLIGNAIVGAKGVVGVARMAADTLDMAGAANSRRQTEAAIKPFDPDFSYDIFEGKILSAIRTIAYSDNRAHCSLYAGSDDLSFMNDLVNIRYRGACRFNNAGLAGDFLQVAVTVFLDNVYYANGQFLRRKENFDVLLVRHKAARTPVVFSAYSVNCSKCGGTFDSILSRQCPYCGNSFVLSNLDWTIVGIRPTH
ncbi:MAG: hypothetical protein J5750_09205, partial [Clostridiales bacterium]|nr:hypothetical protein [Clostridiales bacterium]